MAQGANIFEWEETAADLGNNSVSSARGLRGGSWGMRRVIHALSTPTQGHHQNHSHHDE